jgi:hypothetical protein
MTNNSFRQPRRLARMAFSGVAIAGLASVALLTAARVTPSAGATRLTSATARLAGAGEPPSGTRAESLRLARRLLAKVVLPAGTRRFRGRKLPPSLRHSPEVNGSPHLVDVHKVFTEKWSMRRTDAFLKTHHPAGWTQTGSGSSSASSHGKVIMTEEDVSYTPKRIGPEFAEIDLAVEVAPGHHGHAVTRADLEVTWYPARSAAEHLTAGHFRAVRVSELIFGTHVRNVRRTFRQQAIISKLTRVLNAEHASPGGQVACPLERETFTLHFLPVKGDAAVSVGSAGCFSSNVWVGGREQPALVDSGNVEAIAAHLLHQPATPVAAGVPVVGAGSPPKAP